jgi:2-methylisocitrate lyase-like PEP mutase family enzyme
MKNVSDNSAIERILRAIAQDDELIRQFAKAVGVPTQTFSRWIDTAKLAEVPKNLFIVCRFWLKAKNHPIQEFFAVCTTMDRAQRMVDKLTAKFGPTFIIVDAPLDP